MKRVTAVLICVLIIIGFASCGGNDNDNKQTTSQKAYNTVFKQNTSVVPNTTTAAESETSTTVGEDVSGETEVVETTVARTGKRKFYKQTSAMRNITSAELLQEINAGIVLGDSFSVSGVGKDKSVEDYETAMENPVVAEGLIDAYKSAGFKAVKVPVSWTEHIDENGVINEKWLNRIDEVINMINNLQQKASIPLLLGVDEEGGTVVRISSNKNLRSSAFLSPRTLYKEGGFALIKEDNIEKNNLLKSLGISINLAPVLDTSNDKNDYIYNRSIGLSPKLTGNFAITIIESSKESGIVNVLKHYPGYSKNKDTHKSSSIDTRTISEVEEDLIPFKMAIDNGAEAIMISHNTVTALDDKNPASISINNHNYLRSTLNFKGMIITDALNMGATADIESMGIKSILAGNNILVTKNYARDIKEILDNVSNGNLSNKYLECLAIKIIEWKIEMGLIS